jgi:SAM-dependent methyltransferase
LRDGEPTLASCTVGDARALEFADHTADMVLLLGPLYHLTAAIDRVKALVEARRVLKPGGWLFGAVISRWASALDGLARDLLQDPRFAAIVQRDLEDGQHRNPTERLDYFTTAYFHRPRDVLQEVDAAGFADPRLFGIEGPGWLLPDVHERMSAPRRREDLLNVARLVETEPTMLGISAHLLVVAQKRS